MDKFNEAKAASNAEFSAMLSKLGGDGPSVKAAIELYLIAIQNEAEAFRDMVKDNGYVHTIPLDDLKFSWEE
jgi:hypothetical protein